MNRLLTSKRVISKDISFSSMSTKFHKKEKNNNSCIGKKYKENKTVKARIRKTVKQGVLHEQFTENECSSRDLYTNIEVNSRLSRIPKKVDSNESVIYVSTTYNHTKSKIPLQENIPIVDLTNSSENLLSTENTAKSKQLKTIFFRKRNFERGVRLKKTLATASLVTIPVIKKVLPKKHNSTTVIGKYPSRLSILEIPSQFLSWEDLNYNDPNVLKTCELTRSDHEMIHWILERENQNFELDVTITSSSSGYNSSGMSIEEYINMYDVSSNDCI